MLKKGLLAIMVIVTIILSGCQMIDSTPTISTIQPLTSSTNNSQWEIYTNGNQIRDLLISGNDLWAATEGGVVKWDIQKGTYRKYTTADGLISNSVQALAQDNLGNIWFGTFGGVSRFDGTHWQNFTTKDGLSDNGIISITSDNRGNVVAGALDYSISLYDGRVWQSISARDVRPHLANTGIQQLVVDDSGNIWAVIWGQLERYDGKSWHTLTEADGWNNKVVLDMARAPDGSLWFSTGNRLIRYDGKSWQTVTTGDDNITAFNIAFDSQGTLWCINNTTIRHYDGKSWQTYTNEKLTQGSSGLIAIAIDKNNDVWCGNDGGIFRFDGQAWQTYVTEDSLPDNVIRSMFADRSGNLWFSTDIGITRYDGKIWHTFTPADGLPEGSASSFFQDDQGNIWFGTNWGKAVRYDGKSWQTFTVIDNNNGYSSIDAITQDHQGDLWFGTMNYVIRYDGKSWQKYDLRIGVENMNVLVSDIAVDKSGNIWVSTENNGVMQYNGTDWQVYTTKDGLISNGAGHIFQDSRDRLWFADEGTGKGVDLYDGQRWSTFKLDGLEAVRPIVEDHAGNIWFGSYGEGVVKYDGKNWTNFKTTKGLADDIVNSIIVDGNGNLWFATNGGISRYDGKNWQSFTTASGISSDGVIRVVMVKDGSLWFNTDNGVSHYTP